MTPVRPTPLFWRLVRSFNGLLFVLLALYLAHHLRHGEIVYGVGSGRMSRNNTAVHLDTPLELTFGTLHFGALLFAFGCLAVKPTFFLRRPVLLTTAAVLVVAHLALLALLEFAS